MTHGGGSILGWNWNSFIAERGFISSDQTSSSVWGGEC